MGQGGPGAGAPAVSAASSSAQGVSSAFESIPFSSFHHASYSAIRMSETHFLFRSKSRRLGPLTKGLPSSK